MKRRKHLLVMSGPMGTGHFQAGLGLCETAKELYPDMHVTHIDLKRLMSPSLRFYFTNFYYFLLRRLPWIWRWIYMRSNMPEKYSPQFIRILKPWRRKTTENVHAMLALLRPDYIICTHFFSAEIVGEAKVAGLIDVPVASVVTDFSLHWNYIRPGIDHFFVPDHDMVLITHICGVPLEKITVSGCPLKPVFMRRYSEDAVAVITSDIDIPREHPYVLLTMGGESLGRVEEIATFILDQFPDIGVIVATGNNKQLYRRLKEMKGKYGGRLQPLPYTKDFYRYMLLAFAVITKPGGITVTECCALRKPMIILDPIPGHEEKNAIYISTHGLAVLPNHLYALSCLDLSPNASWIKAVQASQTRFSERRNSEIVLEKVFSLAPEEVGE